MRPLPPAPSARTTPEPGGWQHTGPWRRRVRGLQCDHPTLTGAAGRLVPRSVRHTRGLRSQERPSSWARRMQPPRPRLKDKRLDLPSNHGARAKTERVSHPYPSPQLRGQANMARARWPVPRVGAPGEVQVGRQGSGPEHGPEPGRRAGLPSCPPVRGGGACAPQGRSPAFQGHRRHVTPARSPLCDPVSSVSEFRVTGRARSLMAPQGPRCTCCWDFRFVCSFQLRQTAPLPRKRE